MTRMIRTPTSILRDSITILRERADEADDALATTAYLEAAADAEATLHDEGRNTWVDLLDLARYANLRASDARTATERAAWQDIHTHHNESTTW